MAEDLRTAVTSARVKGQIGKGSQYEICIIIASDDATPFRVSVETIWSEMLRSDIESRLHDAVVPESCECNGPAWDWCVVLSVEEPEAID